MLEYFCIHQKVQKHFLLILQSINAVNTCDMTCTCVRFALHDMFCICTALGCVFGESSSASCDKYMSQRFTLKLYMLKPQKQQQQLNKPATEITISSLLQTNKETKRQVYDQLEVHSVMISAQPSVSWRPPHHNTTYHGHHNLQYSITTMRQKTKRKNNKLK